MPRTHRRFAYEKVGVQFISKRHSQTMPRLSPGPAQYDTAGESVSPKKNKRGTDAVRAAPGALEWQRWIT
jgi:hypothetical protein